MKKEKWKRIEVIEEKEGVRWDLFLDAASSSRFESGCWLLFSLQYKLKGRGHGRDGEEEECET